MYCLYRGFTKTLHARYYCPCPTALAEAQGRQGGNLPMTHFTGAGDMGTGKVLQVGVDLADPCDSPFDQLPPSQRVERVEREA